MNKLLSLSIGGTPIIPPNGVPVGNASSLSQIISFVINLLILASIVLALAYLIYGGFNWIFSGGDKQKLAKSRQHVIYAIIGLMIIFVSFLIIKILGTFFKVDFLNLP